VDDLTRERFFSVPWTERRRRRCFEEPDHAVVVERRIALCGTADLSVLAHGGSIPGRARAFRLRAAIRDAQVYRRVKHRRET
jgi:hypothetical protein